MSDEKSLDDEVAALHGKPAQEETETKEEEDSPIGNILGGLAMIAIGIGIYIYFGHLEEEGGSVRMPAILILIYEFLGRTGIMVIFGLMGALLTWSGISDLRKGKAESDEDD